MIFSSQATSDEGMWLLNEPPKEQLKKKYDFDLTDAWLTKARLASVRFNNGGSGSFLSANGLIITNHHIGADALQKLGTEKRNLYRDGFYAKSLGDELKCPDLELNVLQEIVDVTAEVNASVKPGQTPSEANAARRAVMSAIEKKSTEETKLRSDIVTLYQGGAYHLYRYKKYTDVRLVFSPEGDIAFFGGDTDNFEFPRFNLDICFFRAYENDKPAVIEHYFKFNPAGPGENDLVFVTGHPGTTNRLETLDKLKHRRDYTLPYTLARLRTMEAALIQYSERGPEQKRQAATDLHRVANGRKAFSGQYQGLLNPAVLKTKADQEAEIASKINGPTKDAWEKNLKAISEIQKKYAEFERYHNLLETGTGLASENFLIARQIVRLTTEIKKPSGERLREYRDSNLESLKFQLFSPAPIYKDLERIKLQTSLSFMAETLGGDHATVKQILAGLSPGARVEELVSKTKLYDPAFRKKLVEGGSEAVAACDDPMIQLAIALDTTARTLRKQFEETVEEPERQAYGELAKVRFSIFGKNVAPDATFTLRIAYGTVKGYDADGQTIPYCTRFGDVFAKAKQMNQKEPFNLPKSWLDAEAKLDAKTPFDFVSTADTIGGNSGSPVLNRAGEFIGINFDRNRFGLVRNFVYTDFQARHISVHAAGIKQALEKIYGAEELLKELAGR